jgi:hypothetical protein
MDDNYMLPVNTKICDAVDEYVDTIIKYITVMYPDIEYEVDREVACDRDKTSRSNIVDIQTEYAFVTIFPDFSINEAKAALLNRGLIRAMELEGFDEESIDESPVYGDLMPFSIENAEMFAIILTHDLGLQHQKNL